jgi:hypothetical protein
MFQIDMNSLLKIISVTICLLITSVSLAENRLEIGQINGMHGCIVKYERYHPEKPYTEAVILLAHGFKRNLSSMRGWAKHWSEMGIPVVIPSLCRSSWFKGRHSQNADDLRALREQLKIDEVIYAGFSAGGLAAYLAALEDPATLAYLGLDPVDSAKLGINSDKYLTVPALVLLAKASACNGRNNFLPIIEQLKTGDLVQFNKATHCHFEWPYDRKCALACGRSDKDSTHDRQQEIRQRVSLWLVQLLHLPGPD